MHELRWSTRQEEIITRTMELIQRGGLSHVTMKRIGELVGVSDAALYRHFPTKQALLEGVMDRVGALVVEPVRALARDPELTPEERLERALMHHVEVILDTDGLPILLLVEASASGEEAILERLGGVVRRYLDLLEQLCAALPRSADRPSAADLALLCMGIPAAVAIRHRLMPDPAAERRLVSRLVPFLVGRLGGESR